MSERKQKSSRGVNRIPPCGDFTVIYAAGDPSDPNAGELMCAHVQGCTGVQIGNGNVGQFLVSSRSSPRSASSRESSIVVIGSGGEESLRAESRATSPGSAGADDEDFEAFAVTFDDLRVCGERPVGIGFEDVRVNREVPETCSPPESPSTHSSVHATPVTAPQISCCLPSYVVSAPVNKFPFRSPGGRCFCHEERSRLRYCFNTKRCVASSDSALVLSRLKEMSENVTDLNCSEFFELLLSSATVIIKKDPKIDRLLGRLYLRTNIREIAPVTLYRSEKHDGRRNAVR